jgi:hypothetical protein
MTAVTRSARRDRCTDAASWARRDHRDHRETWVRWDSVGPRSGSSLQGRWTRARSGRRAAPGEGRTRTPEHGVLTACESRGTDSDGAKLTACEVGVLTARAGVLRQQSGECIFCILKMTFTYFAYRAYFFAYFAYCMQYRVISSKPAYCLHILHIVFAYSFCIFCTSISIAYYAYFTYCLTYFAYHFTYYFTYFSY